jgi:hypothetical protein
MPLLEMPMNAKHIAALLLSLALGLSFSEALAGQGGGHQGSGNGGGKAKGAAGKKHQKQGNDDDGTDDPKGKKGHKKGGNQADDPTADAQSTTSGKPDHADKPEKAGDAAKKADEREARQAKRIHEGIKKGYLTPAETQKLQQEQQRLAQLEQSFKADGKISKDESKQLKDALVTASVDIWAEKHDTEGNQKPMKRLGNDIFAKDDVTARIEAGVTADQARAITHDFRTMVSLKQQLANGSMTDAQRAQAQEQYDALLNQYFITRG